MGGTTSSFDAWCYSKHSFGFSLEINLVFFDLRLLEAGPTFKTGLHREGSALTAAVSEHQQETVRDQRGSGQKPQDRAGVARNSGASASQSQCTRRTRPASPPTSAFSPPSTSCMATYTQLWTHPLLCCWCCFDDCKIHMTENSTFYPCKSVEFSDELSTFMMLHNRHLYLVPKLFPTPKGSPSASSPLPCPSWATANLLSISVGLPVLDTPYKWNPMLCGPLWLPSFTYYFLTEQNISLKEALCYYL